MRKFDTFVTQVLLVLGITMFSGCRHGDIGCNENNDVATYNVKDAHSFSLEFNDFLDSAEAERAEESEFEIPPSLVWRMQTAHKAERDRRLTIGQPFDGEEIATKPRGEMKFCDDWLTAEMRNKLWPFDVVAFEATLEAMIVRDENGLSRKKSEPGENLPMDDDGLVAFNPTIRWVNNKIEQWAISQLDAKFLRLDDAAFRKATGYDVLPEGWLAWMLSDMGAVRECFVIAHGEGAWNPRSYMELLCDDDGITIVASFDSFPNQREAAAMRMFGGDIAAVHNLAVLEWKHRIFRVGMDPRRIKSYLEEAKYRNVANAESNLKVLFDHIPKKVIDEAPYTIEVL